MFRTACGQGVPPPADVSQLCMELELVIDSTLHGIFSA